MRAVLTLLKSTDITAQDALVGKVRPSFQENWGFAFLLNLIMSLRKYAEIHKLRLLWFHTLLKEKRTKDVLLFHRLIHRQMPHPQETASPRIQTSTKLVHRHAYGLPVNQW